MTSENVTFLLFQLARFSSMIGQKNISLTNKKFRICILVPKTSYSWQLSTIERSLIHTYATEWYISNQLYSDLVLQ